MIYLDVTTILVTKSEQALPCVISITDKTAEAVSNLSG